MKKIKTLLLFGIISLTACSGGASKTNIQESESSTVQLESSISESKEEIKDTTEVPQSVEKETETKKEENSGNDNIAEEVKNYIMNGQNDKSEAEKIKWSETFLNQVDIDSIYKNYIANGGSAQDINSFAQYLTKNAPIPNNWEELAKNDVLRLYDETAVRFESLGDDLYQVYVVIDGSEVPFVTVSSRTGYFHG